MQILDVLDLDDFILLETTISVQFTPLKVCRGFLITFL